MKPIETIRSIGEARNEADSLKADMAVAEAGIELQTARARAYTKGGLWKEACLCWEDVERQRLRLCHLRCDFAMLAQVWFCHPDYRPDASGGRIDVGICREKSRDIGVGEGDLEVSPS